MRLIVAALWPHTGRSEEQVMRRGSTLLRGRPITRPRTREIACATSKPGASPSAANTLSNRYTCDTVQFWAVASIYNRSSYGCSGGLPNFFKCLSVCHSKAYLSVRLHFANRLTYTVQLFADAFNHLRHFCKGFYGI